MAVTPFKTFSAGEILTASDLNSSLSQVFDNGEDLAWPSTKAKDFNGTELILDADGDSSITADTDDQIDFKLAGTDIFRIATVASAVNAVSITGAATGSAPTIAAFGSDATLNLDLSAKGEATVNVAGESLTTATIFSVAATALTTGTALDISDADALTTGKILNLVSNSASPSTRSLALIHNDNTAATGTFCLEIIQDASGANAEAIRVNHTGDGQSLALNASGATTSDILTAVGNALTTGKILNLVSDSSDTSTRELVTILNDNTAATGTTCLELIQDAATNALVIDQNGDGSAIRIDSDSATKQTVLIFADSLTTSRVVDISADALTTGKILNIVSNSADINDRELVTIHNGNSSATSATCLEVIQDSTQRALFVDHNANGSAIQIDSEATTASVINIDGDQLTGGTGINISCDALTTGQGIFVSCNSSSTSIHRLVQLVQDHASASNSICLDMRQDANAPIIAFDGDTGADTSSAISTLTTPGSIQGFIQCDNGGVKVWIPFYSDPS